MGLWLADVMDRCGSACCVFPVVELVPVFVCACLPFESSPTLVCACLPFESSPTFIFVAHSHVTRHLSATAPHFLQRTQSPSAPTTSFTGGGAEPSPSTLKTSGIREKTNRWRAIGFHAGSSRVIKKLQSKVVWGESTKKAMYARLEQRIQATAESGQKKVSELMREISILKSQLTVAGGSAGEVSGMSSELGRVNDELSTTRSALHDAQSKVDDLSATNKQLQSKVTLLEGQAQSAGMSGDAAAQALQKQIADMQAAHEKEMAEMREKLKAANDSSNAKQAEVDALKQEVANLKVDKAQALAEAEAARERERNELEIRAQEVCVCARACVCVVFVFPFGTVCIGRAGTWTLQWPLSHTLLACVHD